MRNIALKIALILSIFSLAACGGSDGDSETPQATAPTALLSSSAASINSGESVTLSWTSTDADSCTRDWGGSGTRTCYL